jgi:hypothetical protein
MGIEESSSADVTEQKLNVRQRRRKAQRELHTQKFMTARLLGVAAENLVMLTAKTRINIHYLQVMINRIKGK